jgi:hypothetical protein
VDFDELKPSSNEKRTRIRKTIGIDDGAVRGIN